MDDPLLAELKAIITKSIDETLEAAAIMAEHFPTEAPWMIRALKSAPLFRTPPPEMQWREPDGPVELEPNPLIDELCQIITGQPES